MTRRTKGDINHTKKSGPADFTFSDMEKLRVEIQVPSRPVSLLLLEALR